MPRPTRIPFQLLVLCFTILLTACAPSQAAKRDADRPPVTGVSDVHMDDLRFQPAAIQVPAGTTVTWHFDDGNVPHDVKGDGFVSRRQSKGTFRHRFDRPGEYRYLCTLHAGMTGRVVVVAG